MPTRSPDPEPARYSPLRRASAALFASARSLPRGCSGTASQKCSPLQAEQVNEVATLGGATKTIWPLAGHFAKRVSSKHPLQRKAALPLLTRLRLPHEVHLNLFTEHPP